MNYVPDEDGISHINIYSKGLTELGQMLSNFYKFPIVTPDGNFISVEGYWYWLGLEACPATEILRTCYGFYAKQTGKELRKTISRREEPDFQTKIRNAIWYKLTRNMNLLKPEYQGLPIVHYYNYGGKIIDVTGDFQWMIDDIQYMVDYLYENNK